MDKILIGMGEQPVNLLAKYGNRHGLIAGATGTGKTISLMVLAEGFSRMGVPVFIADVKGDVAGLAMAGIANDKIQQRVAQIGIEGYVNEPSPVVFWDMFGAGGHRVRTTVSEIGPSLLGRILELNDIQEGVLEIAFKLADDQGLLLLDLDDLRALLTFVVEHRKEISSEYGLVSPPSVAAIQRALLTLEREGGEALFGEPAFELNELLRTGLNVQDHSEDLLLLARSDPGADSGERVPVDLDDIVGETQSGDVAQEAGVHGAQQFAVCFHHTRPRLQPVTLRLPAFVACQPVQVAPQFATPAYGHAHGWH